MAKVWADRVKETTATTGTGTVTLGGAVGQFQDFTAIGNGNTCDYCILSGNASGWETGEGTVTISGSPPTRTLSRDTIYENSSGGSPLSPINLSGTSIVFCAFTASQVDAVGSGAAGRLIGVQRFTSTGAYTYTPTSGTNSIVIELVGGGAGGAGVASAGAAQVNLGGGGGGGAYLRQRLTANFSGATGSVGAKGTGGAAGNNDGNNGGNTTFVTAGSPATTYTAGGGIKGVCRTSFSPPITAPCGAGGTATNGDDNVPGGVGVPANAPNTAVGWSGGGGRSLYGVGGDCAFQTGIGTSVAGSNGGGKGAGGSGAISSNSGGAKAGGDGTDGVVIIWEYS